MAIAVGIGESRGEAAPISGRTTGLNASYRRTAETRGAAKADGITVCWRELSLEVESLAIMAQAGRQSWQARAWMLERMFPDRYGRRMMLSGGGGSAIKITSQRCNKCSRSPHSGWQSCINADCFGHAAFFAV